MHAVFPATNILEIVLAMLACTLLAVFVIQPAWGRAKRVRRTLAVIFGAVAVGVVSWGVGHALDSLRLVHIGAGIAYTGVLVAGPAAFVMPVASFTDRLVVGKAPVDAMSRRALLRFGSASMPVIAAGAGASGLVSARAAPTMPIVRMRFPGLHRDLEGLKILQLSDLHLGAYMTLDDLRTALAAAKEKHRPDLIVLTGDLADDPSLIPEALRMVIASGARYGAIASLGNHEYLHGIHVTRPLYEKSPVPLLVSRGRSLRIGDATLYIGGSDDPVHMGGDIAWMVTDSIERSIAGAPENAFKLLLCHRPEGHGPAAAAGYDLTLSGHTHGGQIGLFGRSLFEKLRPGIGWWGSYAKKTASGKTSRLYTTSGFGHWFPFRFGCPTEMPIVVLEGAPYDIRVAHSGSGRPGNG